MGPFEGNVEEGRRDTHGVPATDHGEVSEVVSKQDMGDAGGGKCRRVSGNEVVKGLHREMAGNHGAVGGATFLILGVHMGDRVRRRRAQEGGVVAPRGDR